jgi:transposase
MSKHKTVHLTDQQRPHLENLIHSGSAPARTQTRARILLLTDRSQGHSRKDAQIAAALLCSLGTVRNVRHRFLTEGVEAALYDKARPGAKPKITGDLEAQLTVLACSDPPEGNARWTLRLLAERMVALGEVESLSHVSVWERMKKTRSNPGR